MNLAAIRGCATPEERRWLGAAFAIAVLCHLWIALQAPANWDEFYHLTETHAAYSGRLDEALQVFHARMFSWVPSLALDTLGQLRLIRLFMLCFELFAAVAIFGMARRFVSTTPAALAALAYLTAGYVVQHGSSFRADPIAAALLMGSLWILLASKLSTKAVVGAGILAGLALLTSIKVVLYAPAFAAVALIRQQGMPRPEAFARAAIFVATTCLVTALSVWLTTPAEPQHIGGSAAGTVSSSATMQFSEGLFPQSRYLLFAGLTAPFAALLILLTPVCIATAKLPKLRWMALACLLLPLLSLVIYRNSYPYFYVFILPPAMVAAALAAKHLMRIVQPRWLIVLLTATGVSAAAGAPRDALAVQREVITATGEIFPAPVPYFDAVGMMVDYPKANFFMSSWGMAKYRAGAKASFTEIMARETVPLLLANRGAIKDNQFGPAPSPLLLPADAKLLRSAFVHHWGPLWVAGRHFPQDSEEREFEIFAPGVYTLEGAAARINGTLYQPGERVRLSRGAHHFERNAIGATTTLRWGDHLARPDRPFSGGAIFAVF